MHHHVPIVKRQACGYLMPDFLWERQAATLGARSRSSYSAGAAPPGATVAHEGGAGSAGIAQRFRDLGECDHAAAPEPADPLGFPEPIKRGQCAEYDDFDAGKVSTAPAPQTGKCDCNPIIRAAVAINVMHGIEHTHDHVGSRAEL